MIKVKVKKQSNYPIATPKIKKELKDFLAEKGIVSDAIVEVVIVGEKKMLKLASDYLGEKNVLHNVLSFPASETKGEFVNPPTETIHLGEVVVCYPKAVEEAKKENILIEEKVVELLKHGALHLMGIHHD